MSPRGADTNKQGGEVLLRNPRLAAILLAICAVLLAACGGGDDGDSSSGGSRTTSPPRVTLDQSTTPASSDLSGAPPALQSEAGAPSDVKGANASPRAGLQTGVNHYWADDQCHYWYDGSQWHGDFCWGYGSGGVINYYLYPGPGRQATKVVVQQTPDDKLNIIRNVDSPLFQYVEWMAWPKSEQPTASNTVYQLKGRSDWLTVAQTTQYLSQQRNVEVGYPDLSREAVVYGTLANNSNTWAEPNCRGLTSYDNPACPD